MEQRPTRILFLANWPRSQKRTDSGYAFFRRFEKPPALRFFGTFEIPLWTRFEKSVLRFYVLQPLAAFFLSFRYDLVLAYSSQCALPLALLFRIFRRKRPPIVVFDVETFGRPRAGFRRTLVRLALPAIARVVYASSGQKRFYDRFLPEIADRCTHIPIGIGEYAKKVDFEAARDSDAIVAIGRHDGRFRDWRTLLQGYARVADRIRLVIVGRETVEPRDRGGVPIPPGVTFHPYMPIEQLAEHVERARFAVLPLPERNQSLGQLSILFLMAMGKAVIASRVIGVVDYLEPEKTGLFYEPGDADGLARCIVRLLEDPDLAVRMGKNARAAVDEKFNDREMGKRWERCIRELKAR